MRTIAIKTSILFILLLSKFTSVDAAIVFQLPIQGVPFQASAFFTNRALLSFNSDKSLSFNSPVASNQSVSSGTPSNKRFNPGIG